MKTACSVRFCCRAKHKVLNSDSLHKKRPASSDRRVGNPALLRAAQSVWVSAVAGNTAGASGIIVGFGGGWPCASRKVVSRALKAWVSTEIHWRSAAKPNSTTARSSGSIYGSRQVSVAFHVTGNFRHLAWVKAARQSHEGLLVCCAHGANPVKMTDMCVSVGKTR